MSRPRSGRRCAGGRWHVSRFPTGSSEDGEARTVAFGFLTERGFVPASRAQGAADVLPADWEALATARERRGDWSRYELRDNPKLAELIVAVHTGRKASVAFATANGPSRDPSHRLRGRGTTLRLTPSEDALALFEAEAGEPGDLLWERYAKSAPGAIGSLLEDLVTAVDATQPRR